MPVSQPPGWLTLSRPIPTMTKTLGIDGVPMDVRLERGERAYGDTVGARVRLADLLRDIWSRRTDRYSEERLVRLQAGKPAPERERVEMFRVGG